MNEYCDSCERRKAMHTHYKDGERQFLCCVCYVYQGHPPADWHPDCLLAAMRKQRGQPREEGS